MSIQIYPQLNMLLPRVVRDIFIYCCEKGTIKTGLSLKTNTSSESQRANQRDENCDSILSFALPNDVMFKI